MIAVGVFAKPPKPGSVKTRLIPDIGATAATRVYRYCLDYTLEVVRQSGLDYRVFFSETCNDSVLQQEEHSLQKGDDLGQRMYHAFEELLAQTPDGALIIGSDCLDLNPLHLQEAARSLADHELVLIPALDGGYTLIGCSAIDRGLFKDLAWSTDQVYRQTRANAEKLNYRVRSLESLRDIDTLQDLEHYPELLALIASS